VSCTNEYVFQGVILKITDEGRCIVGRILHGGMMHKLGKHRSLTPVKVAYFVKSQVNFAQIFNIHWSSVFCCLSLIIIFVHVVD